jgi:hypothetical protein
MRLEAKALKIFRTRFCADGVMTSIKVSRDSQSGLSKNRSNIVQDFLIAIERLAGPIFRDFRKEAMLDGIP